MREIAQKGVRKLLPFAAEQSFRLRLLAAMLKTVQKTAFWTPMFVA